MDAHLRDLRYFLAVAEELNFTGAAKRLHLSQPALSKQIRRLEATLRVSLFERNRREVRLTAAGNALRDAAVPLLSSWDAAMVSVGEAGAQDSQVLRVGTLTSIGRSLYPAVIDAFTADMPNWRVELRSFGWGDPTAGLHDGQTDVAFLWLPIDAGGVAYQVLAVEDRVLAISTRHPLAKQPRVRFADIVDEPFVALPPSAGILRDFWLAADERAGRPANVVAEVASADETFELVASGAAVHLLASGNATIYVRPGVTCVPIEGVAPAEFAIGWRHGDRRRAVRAFIQACTATVPADTEARPAASHA
jgi:DNA-binding transcriptional LysR family regulator